MKKSYLLSVMIILSLTANMSIAKGMRAPRIAPEYVQPSVEEVQGRKLARQKELARPAVYKMLDAAVVGVRNIDWQVVFSILDSMKGVINVNEYRTPNGDTLLGLASEENNSYAISTLLNKYGARSSKVAF